MERQGFHFLSSADTWSIFAITAGSAAADLSTLDLVGMTLADADGLLGALARFVELRVRRRESLTINSATSYLISPHLNRKIKRGSGQTPQSWRIATASAHSAALSPSCEVKRCSNFGTDCRARESGFAKSA